MKNVLEDFLSNPRPYNINEQARLANEMLCSTSYVKVVVADCIDKTKLVADVEKYVKEHPQTFVELEKIVNAMVACPTRGRFVEMLYKGDLK